MQCYALVSKVFCLTVVMMSEQEMHVSIVLCAIIKFLVFEGVEPGDVFRARGVASIIFFITSYN